MASLDSRARFEALIRTRLPLLDEERGLASDLSLAEYGLDSLGAMGLLVDLEQCFGIEISDTSLTLAAFASPRALWETVSPLLPTNDVDEGLCG